MTDAEYLLLLKHMRKAENEFTKATKLRFPIGQPIVKRRSGKRGIVTGWSFSFGWGLSVRLAGESNDRPVSVSDVYPDCPLEVTP